MKTSLLLELQEQTSEKVVMPTIFYENKIFKLLCVEAVEKKSGKSYFIANTINDKYFIIQLGRESDCDGSFYYTYFIEDFEIETEDFDFIYFNNFQSIMNNHFIY